MARHALDELHDRLYMLEAAVEDVDRDLAESQEPDDISAALEWLLAAARPLCGQRLNLT